MVSYSGASEIVASSVMNAVNKMTSHRNDRRRASMANDRATVSSLFSSEESESMKHSSYRFTSTSPFSILIGYTSSFDFESPSSAPVCGSYSHPCHGHTTLPAST